MIQKLLAIRNRKILMVFEKRPTINNKVYLPYY